MKISYLQALDSSFSDTSYVLDDTRRIELKNSFKLKFFCFREKRQLDQDLNNKIIHFFKERYGYDNHQEFKKIWNKLTVEVWTTKMTLTSGLLQKIDETIKTQLIYHGKGIPQPNIERNTDKSIQHIIETLLHGKQFSPRVLEGKIAKAILFKHNATLMKHFQQELQTELDHLATHLPKTEQEELVWRAFLGNVLALLPYAYPIDGTIVSIPILNNQICKKVNYKIEVIELPYSQLTSPMTALGMAPIENLDAPPILSFIGTTFPAGRGYAATVLSDFTPGHSVGELVYKQNKHKINRWLLDHKNAHVVGTSLGGAMALHTLKHHQDIISRVDVYNPPGLYSKHWKEIKVNEAHVNIYCQPGDIVSKLGIFPDGKHVSLFSVMQHQDGINLEDSINAHVRVLTGCEKITIVKKNIRQENRSFSRYLLTKMHQFLGPLFIFIPISFALLSYIIAKTIHQVALSSFKNRT